MRSSLILLLVVFTLSSGLAANNEFYVATDGRDSNPGTRAKPFATLERARDAVRELKQNGGLPEGGVTVRLRGGVYRIEKTFELAAEDSGTETAPVIYRACEGEEVLLTGGREIAGFKRVADPAILSRLDDACRGNVLQADLGAQGITSFGEMTPRGFGRPAVGGGLELFFQDRPMTLAQWPNDGWARIADVPAGKDAGKFTYEGDRPKRWAHTDDIWLHGYWTYAWAESYVKVKSINTETREIETCEPHGVYGYSKGRRYRVLNVLEELDEPGEWYLDRKTGVLYFWPPAPVRHAEVYVSLLEEPIIRMQDVSHVTVRHMALKHTRGTAVEIKGGGHNLVAGCTLRNIGTTAVRIDGGTENGILSCDVSETGHGGISLQGGDRMTLTPARNLVQNCHIHHFSRWVRTYQPAVAVGGVGNLVSQNLIHDAPHSAIILGGNDHIIQFNEIRRVCAETGDAGAFYMGRDWSQRGNVIRYNYFHHLSKTEGLQGWTEVMAVYLDDWTSGTRVYGNIFYRAGRAAMIGGGRDNTIQNNIFIDCSPAVHVDARGLGWAKNYFDGTTTTLFDRLKAVNATERPYTLHYPELATLLDDEPVLPKGNSITRNVVYGGRWIDILDADKYDTSILDIRDNLLDADPGFVDPAYGDFRLRDDSPAYDLGFKQIPTQRIGLYKDEYRTSLPLTDEGERSIRKLGTLDCDMVETTPVVFQGRLYRFEYVRENYKPNTTARSCFRFVDVEMGETTPAFAPGYHLGSAHVEGDTVYVYGVDKWGASGIRVLWSKDLKTWLSQPALDLPGWGAYNNSVCKGRRRYVMAIELGEPPEEVGARFTMRFAESKDLIDWKLLPAKCVFSKDRYTACPVLRFLDGLYYMIYLEARPGPTYEPHIVRSRDLVNWESSPRNPIMRFSAEDKFIANPKLSAEQRGGIAKAENINNSDLDLCEFQGRTVIYYSWGSQKGTEFLAEAVYPGKLADFLRSFFPEEDA